MLGLFPPFSSGIADQSHIVKACATCCCSDTFSPSLSLQIGAPLGEPRASVSCHLDAFGRAEAATAAAAAAQVYEDLQKGGKAFPGSAVRRGHTI